MERNSFTFYLSFEKAIEHLTDADQLLLYRAISRFSLFGEEPTLSGFAAMGWELIKPILEKSRVKSANGSKSKGVTKPSMTGNDNAKTKLKQSENKAKTKQDRDIERDRDRERTLSSDNVIGEVTAKACTHPLTGGETYEKYVAWLRENAPYIFSHYTNLVKEEQLAKLQETYPLATILQTIMQVENRQDWRKKYTNLYMTLRNWLRKEATNGK